MPTSRGWTLLDDANAANIEQVNTPLGEIDADLSGIETDYEKAFAAWKVCGPRMQAVLTSYGGGANYLFGPDAPNTIAVNDAAARFWYGFDVDDDAFAAAGRTTKFRFSVAQAISASGGGAADYAVTLRQVTGVGGAVGAQPFINGIGAALGTWTWANPAGGVWGAANYSTEFTIPTVGLYAFVVTPSASGNPSDYLHLMAQLYYQQEL